MQALAKLIDRFQALDDGDQRFGLNEGPLLPELIKAGVKTDAALRLLYAADNQLTRGERREAVIAWVDERYAQESARFRHMLAEMAW